jgi:hypothetical protein
VNFNEKRPGASRELRGAENEKSVCKAFFANPRRIVNAVLASGILFGRNLLLNGLAGLGWPWSHRLSLWVDALDQAAEMLRERQGERA